MNQHRTPCSTCPFSRTSTPGELGGSVAETFIGQSHGAFHIPCHCCIDYSDPNWRVAADDVAECAGVAIFRANLGLKTPLLSLPADPTNVFATPAEFLAHHNQVTLKEAEEALAKRGPDYWLSYELRRTGVRFIPRPVPPKQ